MTKIRIIDRPCGFGKSTGLIADLKANINNLNYLLVVPELSEIKRFLDDVGSDLKTPLVEENRIKGGEANNKTDVLIDLYEVGFEGLVASYSSDDNNALYALPIESAEYDLEYVVEVYDNHAGSMSALLLLMVLGVRLKK